MNAIEVLRQQMREVAQRRAERDALAAEIKDARAAFEATLGDKLALLKGLNEAVAMSEDAAKKLAEAIYETTASKQPATGVQIKVQTVYEYDSDNALRWAQATGMALVPSSLDVKAFEKIAKATPIPFVAQREVPRVQLASDLAEYLVADAPTGDAALTAQDIAALPF